MEEGNLISKTSICALTHSLTSHTRFALVSVSETVALAVVVVVALPPLLPLWSLGQDEGEGEGKGRDAR